MCACWCHDILAKALGNLSLRRLWTRCAYGNKRVQRLKNKEEEEVKGKLQEGLDCLPEGGGSTTSPDLRVSFYFPVAFSLFF
jgi:hypothetical protein